MEESDWATKVKDRIYNFNFICFRLNFENIIWNFSKIVIFLFITNFPLAAYSYINSLI